MQRSFETQVEHAVNAWLGWLPRWQPALHRGRTHICRRCYGSPLLAAAGIGADVPHAVQHGLSTRMKTIIDAAVAEYTARNLPSLQAELDAQTARNRAKSYRPDDGLDPEFDGLQLDPDPEPGAPFLFTLSGMADEAAARMPSPPPLTEEEKVALRQEVSLADDFANMVGQEICMLLADHRERVRAAIERFIEPQIAQMLSELTQSLNAPFETGP